MPYEVSMGAGLAHRLELEGLAFHRKVYHGYKRLAQEEPERVLPLDADGEIDKIQREIRKRVYPFLEERGHRGREPGGFR